MSYEGYGEFLCKNGHYWTRDAYSDDEDEECLVCHMLPVWSNSVDCTNGCDVGSDGEMDHSRPGGCSCGHVELKVLDRPVFCECPTCGVVHISKTITFEIPTEWGKRV